MARRNLRPGGLGQVLLLALVHCALICSLPVQAQSDTASEYGVKAAFLFNFAKFIEWPETAFSGPAAPVVICVAGENRFGVALNQIAAGRTVNGRPLQVWSGRDPKELRGCHILFISPSDKKRLPVLLDSVKGAPVVTVSETDKFVQLGGMINFFLKDEQVRFEINLDAGHREGIKFSSKLLSVAKVTSASAAPGSQ